MSKKIITYNKPPFDRMKMVDLADETEEMQWAILDYHNQDFVLNSIVDNTVFTREGHAKFLKNYPQMTRRQYIVYYKDKAIGKLSFTPQNDGIILEPGYFLFHKTDLRNGLGMLLIVFAYHYWFDELKAIKIKHCALKSNKNSVKISKQLGNTVINTDDDKVYFECTRENFFKNSADIDDLLVSYFLR